MQSHWSCNSPLFCIINFSSRFFPSVYILVRSCYSSAQISPMSSHHLRRRAKVLRKGKNKDPHNLEPPHLSDLMSLPCTCHSGLLVVSWTSKHNLAWGFSHLFSLLGKLTPRYPHSLQLCSQVSPYYALCKTVPTPNLSLTPPHFHFVALII